MQILMKEHLLEDFFVLVRTLSQAMPIAIDVTGLEHVVNKGIEALQQSVQTGGDEDARRAVIAALEMLGSLKSEAIPKSALEMFQQCLGSSDVLICAHAVAELPIFVAHFRPAQRSSAQWMTALVQLASKAHLAVALNLPGAIASLTCVLCSCQHGKVLPGDASQMEAPFDVAQRFCHSIGGHCEMEKGAGDEGQDSATEVSMLMRRRPTILCCHAQEIFGAVLPESTTDRSVTTGRGIQPAAEILQTICTMLQSALSETRDMDLAAAALRALPIILAHVSARVISCCEWLYTTCIEVVMSSSTTSSVRSSAAAVLGSLASGYGGTTALLQASSPDTSGAEALIFVVRENVARIHPSDEGIMAGCIELCGFVGAVHCATQGRAAAGSTLEDMVVQDLVGLAVNCLVNGASRMSTFARTALMLVARARGSSLVELIQEHRLLLLETLVRQYSQNPDLVSAFVVLFLEEETVDHVLKETVTYLLPQLMVEGNAEVINAACKRMGKISYGKDGKDIIVELIVDNADRLIHHLLFTLSPDDCSNAWDSVDRMVKQETRGETLRSLALGPGDVQREVRKRVLLAVLQDCCYLPNSEIGPDLERGQAAFRRVVDYFVTARDKPDRPGKTRVGAALIQELHDSGNKDFYTFLLQKLTYEYFSVDNKSPATPYQKMFMWILKLTIPMLGRYTDDFFPTIVSAMKAAQSIVGLQQLACEVWDVLICTAGPNSVQLRASLTQVVVNLFALAEVYPDNVVLPLQRLLIEWSDQLAEELQGIPVYEYSSAECLRDILQVLRREEKRSTLLAPLIARHLRGISSDDETVQTYALKELKSNLTVFSAEFARVFSREDSSEGDLRGSPDKMQELVSLLLRRCSIGALHVRMQAADCLGRIGAIDPERIGQIVREKEPIGDQSDDSLAIEIVVKHLVKVVRSGGDKADKNRRSASVARSTLGTVERAQLVIQCLLDFLGCKLSSHNESPAKMGRTTQHATSQHPGGGDLNRSVLQRSITTSFPDRRGQENWEKFPKDVQQVIRPFLSGSLTFNEDSKSTQYPIFQPQMRFESWIKTFVRDLIDKCEGSRGEMLKRVRPMISKDTIISQFLLPHLVFNIVTHGDREHCAQIRKELLCVLEDARVLEDVVQEGVVTCVVNECSLVLAASAHTSVAWKLSDMTDLSLQIGGEKRGILQADTVGVVGIETPFSKPIQEEAKYTITRMFSSAVSTEETGETATSITQTVFALIDALSRWHEAAKLRLRRSERSKDYASGGCQSEAVLVEQERRVGAFLSEVPRRVVAETSYRCAAYDRALLYLETAVRERWKRGEPAGVSSGSASAATRTRHTSGEYVTRVPPLLHERCDQGTVELFQRIYAGLDDADGLMGIAHLRVQTSLEEHILDAEIAGDWTKALACYEQALQQAQSGLRNHFGLLRCFRNLGHLQSMLTHADGGIARYERESANFRAQGIQAAWRLGRWDLQKEYLQAAETHNDFGGKVPFENHVSQLLLSLRDENRERPAWQKVLKKARQSVLEPLAAASMESYQRAYPLLLRLHILHELDRAATVPSLLPTRPTRLISLTLFCCTVWTCPEQPHGRSHLIPNRQRLPRLSLRFVTNGPYGCAQRRRI